MHKAHTQKIREDGQTNINICRNKQIHTELDSEVVRNLFKQHNPQGAMKAVNLRAWIATRYTDKLAGHMVNHLKATFHDFVPPMGADDYIGKIRKWLNKNEDELRSFAFNVFDIESKGRITQDNLFTFMEYFKRSKKLPGGADLKESQILNLD
jgi:Ca2+-binding EF-hand superfamily protein